MLCSRSLLIGFLLCCSAATPLRAATLTLSDFASNGGSPPSADVLDATLTFEVTGPGQLELRAANLTADPDAFFVSQIFFNAQPNVTGLGFPGSAPAPGWELAFETGNGGATHADGFGIFDFVLRTMQQDLEIAPGESLVLSLAFTGSGVVASDFTSALSRLPAGGNLPSVAAAKFVRGPGDSSAFGNTVHAVPEPGATVLLALGLSSLGALRRGRASS